MQDFQSQVWVTSVASNEDASKALALCCSLRRVYTSRKIAVLVSVGVAFDMRKVLKRAFDFVFNIDEEENEFALDHGEFAKIYSLAALQAFKKCVYLSPTTIALQNCDEIFATGTSKFQFLKDRSNTSLYLFTPSITNYERAMKWVETQQQNDGVLPGNIRAWVETTFGVFPHINDKFYATMSKSAYPLAGIQDGTFLLDLGANFLNSNIHELESTGIFGKLVAKHLWKIYDEDVLPLFTPSLHTPYPQFISSYENQPIAVVGMSCRYPASNNLEEFWELLIQGEDGISNPPPSRWSKDQVSKIRPNARNVKAGFLKSSIDSFDAKFFGVSPKEALYMDPQHRLIHELVWESLEDACIDPQSLDGSPGSVFMGSWTNDYKDGLIRSASETEEVYRIYMGNSIGAAAARISFLLGLTGPSIATESGCSSAMVAVHLACKALQRGETNLALACGVNLLIHQFEKNDMPMVVSSDGHCNTFSEDADGFARAEGGGVMVLKTLSDALQAGDRIWGLIRGSAVSQEGISKSMGSPTVECESLAMKEALLDADLEPHQISYVEAHGTGTVIGDPIEIAAIAKAYNSEKRKEPLIIGSVKTNVGHTESCSGITGIMKVILAMKHEMIPEHRNFTKLNPEIDLSTVPAVLPLQQMEWKRLNGKSRIAGVSSFGITGTDAHVIIEEPPQATPSKVFALDKTDMPRPTHILKLSTKTEEAMSNLLEKYKAALETSTEDIADIAYSANTGRPDFPIRIGIVANDKASAIRQIDSKTFLRGEAKPETIGKICFLFTGQGSQYQGMGLELYKGCPAFRFHFDMCDKILQNLYNMSITKIMWPVENGTCENELSRTIYSQVSLFCVGFSLFKTWESWGVKPDYVLGHSLGEFVAAACAGMLSLENALQLVVERSKLIDQLPPGNMLAVHASQKRVEDAMSTFAGNNEDKRLDCAAINSEEQTVVSGDPHVVLEFAEFCKNNGIKSQLLKASHAFHSRRMDSILQEYRAIAEKILSGKRDEEIIGCEYISGMTGDLGEKAAVDTNYWVRHAREKVRFLKASRKAADLGCKTFIEIGTQPVLSSLTFVNNENIPDLMLLPSLKRNEEEWTTILGSVAKLYVNGFPINWAGIDRFYDRKKVSLPHYPFIGKKFWIGGMLSAGEGMKHPLIGSPVPNATSTKLFECRLTKESNEYLGDHKIGETIVFPGAGYLEMSLAAGLAAVEGPLVGRPSHPMKVLDLIIKAPLSIENPVQIQTVVEFSDYTDEGSDWNLNIKTFHRLQTESPSDWLLHSEAIFSPVLSAEEKNPVFKNEHFLETISSPCWEESFTELYKKLLSQGLNFGPAFKSLEKAWRHEDGTVVVKVTVPSGDESSPPYIVHPVILDSLLQAIMLPKLKTKVEKKLVVPIRVGKFFWLSEGNPESNGRYIYVDQKGDGESGVMGGDGLGATRALLLDSEGIVLGVMSNIELIETTAKTLESVLEQQVCRIPQMWEETWRSHIGAMEYTHDTRECASQTLFSPDFCTEALHKYNDMSVETTQTYEKLEKLVFYNILRAMYLCGLELSEGKLLHETDLERDLGVKPELRKLLSYFLRVLAEENILERGELPRTWKSVGRPPTLQELNVELSSPTLTVDLIRDFKPTQLFLAISENLPDILQGRHDPLNNLFPDENAIHECSSAGEFYTHYGRLIKAHNLVLEINRAQMDHCKEHSTGSRKIVRILEIGAGSGELSEQSLKMMKESGVEFEYTHTDISKTLISSAEKRLADLSDNVTFKELNIDEDPISQGFLPAYYDVIEAHEVLHATKNLMETMANIKILLKPGGILYINEQTRVNRLITYLFGGLDVFWGFEDTYLRPDHCTVSAEQWTRIHESAGFDVIQVFPSGNYNHSLICSRRKFEEFGVSRVGKENDKTWLLFHEESSPTSEFIRDNIQSLTDRRVIVVRSGENYDKFEGGNFTEFVIRADEEEDFIRLMGSIGENGTVSLEGIVYCWSLNVQNTSQERALKPFFYLSKSILKLKGATAGLKLTVFTKGVAPLEQNEFPNLHSTTIWGFVKTLLVEQLEMHCRCVDIGTGDESESKMMSAFYEIWGVGKEIQVAFQKNARFVPKVTSVKPTITDLKLPPGTDRFQLILPESKSISDLEFGPLEPMVLAPGEIEIQVKATALNFKDVLNILKPSEDFRDSNTVGFDFAGVVKRIHPQVTRWHVGDRVVGINLNETALPSHVKLHENEVLPVSNEMTFSEACTLPAVGATSYHCLVSVANVQKEDTVLIHTASGGVGLCAIQICKRIGAKIIATAGSRRKRNYLRSLGIQDVFHSRDTHYSEEILRVTNGRGVDVVLNSLTGEGFKEATLKCCALNARFVEMSKLLIWKPEEVQNLRPDVKYTVVDLSAMDRSEWIRILGKLWELQEDGFVEPIPYVRFDGLNVSEALRYLQKAKHIGKIVCTMPEVRNVNGRMETHTPLFNSNSTYLITGGLGGIGFEVCKWMLRMGATHILLVARSLPNAVTNDEIARLNVEYNSKVVAVQLDISNFEDCRDLILSQIKSIGFPALRGIMHAAGTLHDGMIENHTWESLSSTFDAKVTGTWNLHELTKTIRPSLEFFVMFSSAASAFGSPGQSNHSAGNQFEDSVAYYRNSIGLKTTTINWGAWGEVGVATEFHAPGSKPLSNLQGISGLEYALKSGRTQTIIWNVESFALYGKFFPHLPIYLDDSVWKEGLDGKSQEFHINYEQFWSEYDTLKNFEEKVEMVKEKLRFLLRNILRLDANEEIAETTDLRELGVDSLMLVEIRNALQTFLGDRGKVKMTILRDSTNIKLLGEALVREVEGVELSIQIPTADEVMDLIKEDSILPDHIYPQKGQEKVDVSDVSIVLLTGCSGRMGPGVIKELCDNPQIREVICLLRPKRNISSEARLRRVLEERDLLNDTDMSKVRCVLGDVTSPELGMESKVWEELCDRVDAVYHFAALARHTDIYRKEDVGNNVRFVNIGGLKNILNFCCSGRKLKHVFYASALLAVATLDKDSYLSEDWPEFQDYYGITHFSYPISSFVGDMLMKEAVTKRGIPGKVFRYPFISGDSKTGRFRLEENHLMLRYMFILKTGIMTSHPSPMPILPIDVAVKLSSNIFFNPSAPNEIYNLINLKIDVDQEFVDIAKRFGYKVKIVDFNEFSKRVMESPQDSPLALFKEFYKNENVFLGVFESSPAIKKWLVEGGRSQDFYLSRKVTKLYPGFFTSGPGRGASMEYVYNDLLFAKKNGYFEKFGL